MRVKLYYVYILLCSDGSYYVGFSNNPERRFQENSEGLDPESYTFRRRPLKLVYTVAFMDPVEGIEFEKQIKRWSKAKKEALINGDIKRLKSLAVSKQKHIKKKNRP